MKKKHVYIVGVVMLGFFHSYLKSAAPSQMFFLFAAITYLVLLSFIAEKFGKP